MQNSEQNFEYNMEDVVLHTFGSNGEINNCISTNEDHLNNLNYSSGSCMEIHFDTVDNPNTGNLISNIESCETPNYITNEIAPKNYANINISEETEINRANLNSSNVNKDLTSNCQSCSKGSQNDQCVYKLLEQWELEMMYPILETNEIDIIALKYMDKHYMKKMLTTCSMGISIKFEQYLRDWQQQQGTYYEINAGTNDNIETAEDVSSSSATIIQNKTSESRNVTLREILQQSLEGNRLSAISNDKKRLTDENRSFLITSIVNYHIQNNIRMGVNECESMASQITHLFPDEKGSVYFKRRPKQKPKGLLYDRYNNYTAKLRQSEFLPKAKRFKPIELCIVEEPIPEADGQEICQYLKYNRDDSNQNLIMEKWEASVIYRKKTIRENQDGTIKTILEEWPAYTQSYGAKLICIDFNYIYPEATNLFLVVDKFVNDVLFILKEKLVDPPSKKLFKEFQQQRNTTTDAKHFVTFHLLHGLVRPTTKKCQIVNNKKIWNKYTISDSQNSFMIFAKSIEECENIIRNKKTAATNHKSTIQPFVFIVGANEFSPAYFYVYLDGIKYKFPSIVAAIDCAFKLFHVFNIKYPEESVAVWLLLQKHLYNVETAYDAIFPTVDLFISKLSST